MKAFGQLVLILFLLVASVGYLYFGPPKYTGLVTKTDVYRYYVGPYLDKLFSGTGRDMTTVAYLVQSSGEFNYRPNSELVFSRASDGQRFGNGTLVATGDGAVATIALLDDSKVELQPNSTLLLEAPVQQGQELSAVTLKVVSGAITAQKSLTSKVAINIVTPRGTSKELTQGARLAVVTPRKIDASKQPDAAKGTPVETEEFIGETDKAITDIQKELLSGKSLKLDASQSAIETQAAQAEAARQALQGQPPPSTGLAIAPVDGSRMPASVSAAEGGGTLAPQKIGRRPRSEVGKWAPPPKENDLSRAVYAKRLGQTGESKRLMARSLVQRKYASVESFTEATRVALDGLMESYVSGGNKALARDTLKNVEKNYPADPTASSWVKKWKSRLAAQR